MAARTCEHDFGKINCFPILDWNYVSVRHGFPTVAVATRHSNEAAVLPAVPLFDVPWTAFGSRAAAAAFDIGYIAESTLRAVAVHKHAGHWAPSTGSAER